MKKILSLLLTIAMVFSMSATAFAADFTDVSESHDNYEAIETLETLDIVNGYGNDTYGPNDILTRAHICTMLVNAMYEDDIHYNDAGAFADVPLKHWARASIDTAQRNGLVAGYGNNLFGPDDNLTYTQTARIILNALGYGTLEWPVGVNTVAYELGLYENIRVTDLDAGCTRAHAAQMLYNAFDCDVVREYAGQHFTTNKNFLNDILGFEKTSKYIDGHIYIAYNDLTDGEDGLFVTDIHSTSEQVIYPYGTAQYKLSDTYRAEKFDINWAYVDLFVNGVDVNDASWFYNSESAIGVFDDEGYLIAIYVVNNGEDIVPGDANHEVFVRDRHYDSRTSTITYFAEDGYYRISNDIVCGFVTDVTRYNIWIDDVKYSRDEVTYYNEGTFVILYLNYRGEIAGSRSADINEIYHYDIEEMMLHTWECDYYNYYIDNGDMWMTYDEVKNSGDRFVDKKANNGVIYFDTCPYCHSHDADEEFTDIVPVEPPVIEKTVYYMESGEHYHYNENCSYLNENKSNMFCVYESEAIQAGKVDECPTCSVNN